MKNKTAIIIAACFLPLCLKAQVSKEITTTYSGNIVARVNEITSKVNLPVNKQVQLAKYFKSQDSLANAGLKRGLSAAEISHFYITKPEDLKSILSTLELIDYKGVDVINASMYEVALKNRSLLNLEPKQVTSIMQKLPAGGGSMVPDDISKKNEVDFLLKELNEKQYKGLLGLILDDKIKFYANDDWQKIKSYGISKNPDTTAVKREIYNFQSAKTIDLEYGRDVSEDKYISIRKVIDNSKPIVLRKLDAFKEKTFEKQLESVVKFRKEIGLNDNQLDQVLTLITSLEQARVINAINTPDKAFNSKPIENEMILKTLSNNQYTKFLTRKNTDKAQRLMKDDWAELLKFGLVQHKDSLKITQQAFKLELERLVVQENFLNKNLPHKADSARKKIEISKPIIFWKMDAYKNSVPRSQFSDAIKFREVLKLDASQIDSLVGKLPKLEALRFDYKRDHPEGGQYYARPFEDEHLKKILSPNQYNDYLIAKNFDKANTNATKDWVKLKELNLVKGLDSNKIGKEIITYELKMLVVRDRLALDKSVVNVTLLKDLETNKPDCLKKLEDAIKTSNVDRQMKQKLAW